MSFPLVLSPCPLLLSFPLSFPLILPPCPFPLSFPAHFTHSCVASFFSCFPLLVHLDNTSRLPSCPHSCPYLFPPSCPSLILIRFIRQAISFTSPLPLKLSPLSLFLLVYPITNYFFAIFLSLAIVPVLIFSLSLAFSLFPPLTLFPNPSS